MTRLPSDHLAEVVVLAIIAVGVMALAGLAIDQNDAGEASAWTAVLMAIIGAIKERWQSRSIDAMGRSLANAPPATPPAGQEDGPRPPPGDYEVPRSRP